MFCQPVTRTPWLEIQHFIRVRRFLDAILRIRLKKLWPFTIKKMMKLQLQRLIKSLRFRPLMKKMRPCRMDKLNHKMTLKMKEKTTNLILQIKKMKMRPTQILLTLKRLKKPN